MPRVIGQVPLELKKRESKERLFPEINNDKYKNDIAIALSVNLCINKKEVLIYRNWGHMPIMVECQWE